MENVITVFCEKCGKLMNEDKASAFYMGNNYITCCTDCYDKMSTLECEVADLLRPSISIEYLDKVVKAILPSVMLDIEVSAGIYYRDDDIKMAIGREFMTKYNLWS